jgi:AcrR family transcriptional regulator
MAPGLRERRKQQTRQTISDIATKMFAARGFDEVTISQVADAAGVAKMTVTNYFPRKEDLVFDLAEEIIGHLAKVVATRLPGESMLAAIRRDYADAVARADVTLGLSSSAFVRMIQNSPVLTNRALEVQHLREQALGDAIAAETGTDGPQERLVAALLASVHRVLNAEASRRSLAGQPRAQICAVLADAANRAFDLLEPAIGGYGIRAQPGSTGHPGDTGPASSVGRPGSIGQRGSR